MRTAIVVFVVLLIDQVTKIKIKTSMQLGDSFTVLGDWLKITFTQNEGMAFGVTFGKPLMITIFAMIATVLIAVYLGQIEKGAKGHRFSMSLILGGAIGNIIDRVFYGKIFGYAGFFGGEVVDFIHVHVWDGRLPDFIPGIGGNYISLFPIWNVADMAIVTGVCLMLIFFRGIPPLNDSAEETEVIAEPTVTEIEESDPRVSIDNSNTALDQA